MSHPPAPSAPRKSASLILLSRSNRLLLLQRSSTLSFSSAHVFPGGVLSAADPSPLHCALRETFEETGLLLTTSPPPASVDLQAARKQIHNHALSFSSFLSSFGGQLATQDVIPASTWITPAGVKSRYENQFFIGVLPEWIDADTGARQALGDGGVEVVEGTCRFWDPREASEKAKIGEITFFPPQAFFVDLLVKVLVGRESAEREREKLWDLVKETGMGEKTVMAKMVKFLDDGKGVLSLGELGKALVVTMKKKGVGVERALKVVDLKDVAKL